MVGAVIVKSGEVIGRGYHRRAGTDHAEVVALREAGPLARGSDLYVNLEPCSHQGRTGPCTRSIIEAGVRRVILGIKDPNPLVDGRGIRALRRAGVDVTAGILEEACLKLNETFACYMVHQRPFVTFKAAITLDGRVAARSGDSCWVTGEAARREAHKLRSMNDAVIVGVGTVLADDPQLTCRGLRNSRDPVRVIVDSRLSTPPSAKVVTVASTSMAPTWIFTTASAQSKRRRALEKAGAQVIQVAADNKRVDIREMLHQLAERDVMGALLESGPTLAGSFWRAGLVDRVVVFIAPKILGDPRGLPMIDGHAKSAMVEATLLREARVRQIGEDIMVTGKPCLPV